MTDNVIYSKKVHKNKTDHSKLAGEFYFQKDEWKQH